MNNKKYLVNKKGNDGSDLKKTNFVVSPGAIDCIKTNENLHQPLMALNLDNANNQKIRQDLVELLKDVGMWSIHYDSGQTFGNFLREDFDSFHKEYKKDTRLSQKEVALGQFKIKIPQPIKDVGIKYIQKTRQGN